MQAEDLIEHLLDPQQSLRAAFVFAHRDDSVLSAFAALAASGRDGLDVVVFGGAPPSAQIGAWDEAAGFATPHEAWMARRVEHRDACRGVIERSLALELVDGEYGPPSPGHLASAISVLENELASFAPDVLVTHSGDALHPDHRIAGDVALKANSAGVPTVHVCDRPYLWCRGNTCDRAPGQTAPTKLTDDLWERKQYSLGQYRSQLAPLTDGYGPEWSSRDRLGWECFHLVMESAAA